MTSVFLESKWLLPLNFSLLIILGLVAYWHYSRRWNATTGRYFVKAKVVSQEFEDYKAVGIATVYVSYRVDGKNYLAELKSSGQLADLNDQRPKILTDYTIGSTINVYYAPKDPSFHSVAVPPTVKELKVSVVFNFLIYPLLLANFLFYLLSLIVNANS